MGEMSFGEKRIWGKCPSVVDEQLQLVQHVIHHNHKEGEVSMARALLSRVMREISLLCRASGDHCKIGLGVRVGLRALFLATFYKYVDMYEDTSFIDEREAANIFVNM